ncbi:hypothetical protein R1flu_027259 [Riccia fluitans]|uniref:non-specific serine/threonine protein kinase n=1 Tax=Riccia fluitans TaxID=41844 RepID=A0ABD1XL83_9MARC
MSDGSGCSVMSVLLILLLSTLFRSSTLCQALLPPDQGSTCADEDDRCILLQFKNGLKNQGGESLQSWNNLSTSVSWSGVTWRTREDDYMYAEKVQLRGFGLDGDIFPLLHKGLLQLSELDVSNNSLSGSLPSTLKISAGLRALNLSRNSLEGLIPIDVQSQLPGNISSQVVTEPAVILESLDLSYNKLWGEIPESFVGALPGLQVLDLSGNNLTGYIPSEFGQLSNLTTLRLHDSYLNGSIPQSLSSCLELVELMLGGNNISGTIPLEIFSTLPKLENLDLSFNNFTGELHVPVKEQGFKNLRRLVLSGNHLNGSVPEALGSLGNLEVLELKGNNFSGQLPTSLSRLSRLTSLNLQKNSLTGPIPAELGQLSNLASLRLGNNKLSGEIPPSLGNCSKLRSLFLYQNHFTGVIPLELYRLKELVVLSLFGNALNGTISPEIRYLSSIMIIDFSWNQFRGSIPEEVCQLSGLRILVLNNNLSNSSGLSGSLPRCIWDFAALQILDLSHNNFSGSIPRNFSGLSAMRLANRTNKFTMPDELRMTNYDQQILNSTLSWKLQESPTLIFLSSNHLEGEIPTGFGELQNLQELDLSSNHLVGPIPGALGNATALFLLNLADNQLNGTIPSELMNLNFLSQLNLSYNHLVGRIPQGYQFFTFTSASFDGNPGLCGYPLNTSCSSPSAVESSITGNRQLSKKLLMLYIVGSSALATFSFIAILITCSCVACCKRRRCSSSVSHSCDLFENNTDHQFFHVTISSVLPSLTPKELALATDCYNEKNIIGDGGFGLVYKAVLNNGAVVAVKKLLEDGLQGDSEFLAEMQTLGKIKHKNLICLRGYCSHGREKILVYEYLENGSLDSWLHCREEGNSTLDWMTRLKIARSAAEGLAFLHHECVPAIIHRDVKVSNILLDSEFESRLADFGLARSARAFESHVSTGLAGTAGYIPPEYCQGRSATLKGDVYSFGVVMLELITGKRPTDPFYKKKDMSLVSSYIQDVAWRDEALDKSLRHSCSDQMVEFMRIAGSCCNPCPSQRPSMNQVVRMLEILESQSPSRNPSVVFQDDESISSPGCR